MLFWFTFVVVASLVVINLFIGVILETFALNLNENQETKSLKSIKDVTASWNDEDRKATGILPAKIFWTIVLREPFPAGFGVPLKGERNNKFAVNDDELYYETSQRFSRIKRKQRYEEPSTSEVIQRIAKIKLLVHRGYVEKPTRKEGKGRQSSLLPSSSALRPIGSMGVSDVVDSLEPNRTYRLCRDSGKDVSNSIDFNDHNTG